MPKPKNAAAGATGAHRTITALDRMIKLAVQLFLRIAGRGNRW